MQVTTEENFAQSKKEQTNYQSLSENQVYSELQIRGFQYSGPFRTICKSSVNGDNGCLVWKDNWITFLDGMIQMYIFGNTTKKAQVPIKIRNIFIDTKLHEEIIARTNRK